MKIIKTVKKMQSLSDKMHRKGRSIGFVPTMGALHEGHLSLIKHAAKRCDRVVVSIFVNPAQFGPDEDLSSYPRDFQCDEKLAKKAGADIIFYPSAGEMYPNPFLTWITVDELTDSMCGASRPGHFRGVTTVCAKLFNAVKPDIAVFGQKDYQQALIITRMVKDLNLDMKVITAPIVREKDGLAMSSRNTYLSPGERNDALCISESLRMVKRMVKEGESSAAVLRAAIEQHIQSKKSAKIDYIAIVNPENLVPVESLKEKTLIALAVFIGTTRLIDNAVVKIKKHAD